MLLIAALAFLPLSCSRTSTVPQSTKELYDALGFEDKNGDGEIDVKEKWLQRDEGYIKEADINSDGKIVRAEAKYYLQQLGNVDSALKSKYSLVQAERVEILNLQLEVARKIKDPIAKSNTINKIACEMAKEGVKAKMLSKVFSEAMTVADEINGYKGIFDRDAYSKIVSKIITAMIDAGLFVQALGATRNIINVPVKRKCIIQALIAMEEHCSQDSALAEAKKIELFFQRQPEIAFEIIKIMVNANKLSEAIEFVNNIIVDPIEFPNPQLQKEALLLIIEVLVENKSFADAVSLASTVDPGLKASAIEKIVDEIPEASLDKSEAKRFLYDSLMIAKTIENLDLRFRAITAVADAAVEANLDKKDVMLLQREVSVVSRAIEKRSIEEKRRIFNDVRKDGYKLAYASDELKANRELVLAAVRQNGMALQYADPNLRQDRQVVLAAVRQDVEALRFVPAMGWDREIILEAAKINGRAALFFANDAFREDKEIVRVAILQSGEALSNASDALRADRNFVRWAVGKHGIALCWASDALQNDAEIVSIAIKQDQEAKQCAH
ncbi:MAG: DUF4116 domain-containing protein [Candidatus Margulisiibacteriota bacterium]